MNKNYVISVFLTAVWTLLPVSMQAFTIINNAARPLCLQLDWYTYDQNSQAVKRAHTDGHLNLDAKSSQEIALNRQYDQVWVTVVHEDGAHEEPYKLMVVETYEPDKS